MTLKDSHLNRDHLDVEVREALDLEPELVVYASKHRSESGMKSLTAHPMGNFGEAGLGGVANKLVPTAPHWMTEALRRLKTRSSGLEYAVSFEATHHGPYLETPAFYIEVGSDEVAWEDDAATSAIAAVLAELEPKEYPVAVGVGGGHYLPRITDIALSRQISFGHLIPSYALKGLDESTFSQALERSPDVSLAYVHRKAVKGEMLRRLERMVDSQGLRIVQESELAPLPLDRRPQV